jgi:carbon-monoxide dehydrogenase small subunit
MAQENIPIRFTLNGQSVTVSIPSDMTALTLLRDVLHLKGTKEGCGEGECGACTIQVDGKAVNACLMFAAQLDGRTVRTVEGLGEGDTLDALQTSFLENHAVQCGFCTPGMLMSAGALLEERRDPERPAIKEAIAGNLCRCTGYHHILRAIESVVREGVKEEEER